MRDLICRTRSRSGAMALDGDRKKYCNCLCIVWHSEELSMEIGRVSGLRVAELEDCT